MNDNKMIIDKNHDIEEYTFLDHDIENLMVLQHDSNVIIMVVHQDIEKLLV